MALPPLSEESRRTLADLQQDPELAASLQAIHFVWRYSRASSLLEASLEEQFYNEHGSFNGFEAFWKQLRHTELTKLFAALNEVLGRGQNYLPRLASIKSV